MSAMAAGSVEGSADGALTGLDVRAENEKERLKTKGLKEQDSVVNEIVNYLLMKKRLQK
jgi:hypothetical protein